MDLALCYILVVFDGRNSLDCWGWKPENKALVSEFWKNE